MAIIIQTETPSIPIHIGNLVFEFDVSDESVKKFRRDAARIQKEMESIEVSNDDDQSLEQAKDALRRGFELMLGYGAYDKIYELSPSVIIVMKYFAQIGEAIAVELDKMGFKESQMEKAQKYLTQKNQHPMMRHPIGR